MKFLDYDIKKVLSEIDSGKRLVCFGGKNTFDTFCLMFSEYQIENFIEYIADNDKNLWNTNKVIKNKVIPISSMDTIIGKSNEDIIIIITCNALKEIYCQLEQMNNLDHVTLCFWGYVLDTTSKQKNEKNNYTKQTVQYKQVQQIPKVIHYCWFGENAIPDRYRAWMKSWRKYCPDYEIVEWNESNYDVMGNKYMLQAYEAKKWGFVSDYARLDIIYQYGGVYLDTDVELLKNLDEFLCQKAFCGFEDEYYIATGLGFGSIPHNIIIQKLRDYYNNLEFIKSDGSYNLDVCPIHQTSCLLENGLIPNGNYQELDDINVYPKMFFSPLNRFTGEFLINENTVAIHHGDASWLDINKKKQIDDFRKFYLKIKDNY